MPRAYCAQCSEGNNLTGDFDGALLIGADRRRQLQLGSAENG